MTLPQRISFNPDPPSAGSYCQICYDFSGLEISSTELRVSFDPAVVSPATYTVTKDAPCITIMIPEAESVTVEDLDGPSPDKYAGITP